MSIVKASAAVAKGVAELDRLKCCTIPCSDTNGKLGIVPSNWRTKIKASTLDLGDGYECVLGQIFGNYTKGLEKLGHLDDTQWGRENGFESSYSEYSSTELTTAWKVALGFESATDNQVIKVGDILKVTRSLYGTHHRVEEIVWFQGEKQYITVSGLMTRGKFDVTDATDHRVRSRQWLLDNTEAVPSVVKGDFLVDPIGNIYVYDDEDTIWKLRDRSTYASRIYWENASGPLTLLETAGGTAFRKQYEKLSGN